MSASTCSTCTLRRRSGRSGESFVTVDGATVIVNSDASDAAFSNGGTLTASDFKIVGGTTRSAARAGSTAAWNTAYRRSPIRCATSPSRS